MIYNDDWGIKSRVKSEQFLGPVDHAMSRDGHIYFLTKNNNYSKNIFIYHNHHHDPQDTIYYTLRAQNYPGEQKQCI